MARRELSAEQKAEFAAARQAELERLQGEIAQKAAAIAEGPQWQEWLTVAAKFHKYSFKNQLLIMMQRPDAVAVAGFNAWRDNFGRQVLKGEKGIRILAPVTKRIDKLDSAGRPVIVDGKPVKETRMVGVKLVSVFDVSQTDGRPLALPPRPDLLRGQAPEGLWDSLAQIVTAEGYKLERGDCGHANGYTDFAARVVRVRDDVDEAQAVKTLAHELGHVLLHEPSDGDMLSTNCRGRIEVEAESVAFLVTNAHGLASDQYSFAYVANWARHEADQVGKDVAEVVAETGKRVVEASHTILDRTQPPTVDVGAKIAEARVEDLSPDRQQQLQHRAAALQTPPPVAATASTAVVQEPLFDEVVTRGRAQGL